MKVEKTIDALKGTTFDIYTDGSAINSNENRGPGVWIRDNRTKRSIDLKAPAGRLTCSYRAELIAIHTALNFLNDESDEANLRLEGRTNIFTDSKSAVERPQLATFGQTDTTHRHHPDLSMDPQSLKCRRERNS